MPLVKLQYSALFAESRQGFSVNFRCCQQSSLARKSFNTRLLDYATAAPELPRRSLAVRLKQQEL